MSEEQFKAFLEKAQGYTSLQEKLKAAADSDAVLAIAKEAGFSFSADDLIKAQQEVMEDELGGVSGRGETSFEKDLVKYLKDCRPETPADTAAKWFQDPRQIWQVLQPSGWNTAAAKSRNSSRQSIWWNP